MSLKLEIVAADGPDMSGQIIGMVRSMAQFGRDLVAALQLAPAPAPEPVAAVSDVAEAAPTEPVAEKPRRGRPPKAAAPEAPPPVEPAAPIDLEQAIAATAPAAAHTKDDVRNAILAFVNKKIVGSTDPECREKAMAELFDTLKVERKLSLLPEDRYGEMVALAEAKLAELS
jgi:hypothetical protein